MKLIHKATIVAFAVSGKMIVDHEITNIARKTVVDEQAKIKEYSISPTPAHDVYVESLCLHHGAKNDCAQVSTFPSDKPCRRCHDDKIFKHELNLQKAQNWLRRSWWLQFMSGWPRLD